MQQPFWIKCLFAISTFLLFVAIVTQVKFNEFLFAKSVELTSFFQNTLTTAQGRNVLEIAALTISYFVYVCFSILFIFTALSNRKHLFFYVLIIITLGFGVFSLLKNIFHNPRPFMTTNQIISLDCDSEFGFPSGHAFMTVLFFYTVYSIQPKRNPVLTLGFKNSKFSNLWESNTFAGVFSSSGTFTPSLLGSIQLDQERPTESEVKTQTPSHWGSYLVFSVVITVIVWFARIICGAHTFMQVISGSLFSIVYCLFLEMFFSHFYFKVVCQSLSQNKRRIITIEILCFFFFNALNLLTFFCTFDWIHKNREEVYGWLQQIKKCDPMVDKILGQRAIYNISEQVTLDYKCLLDSCYSTFGFVALILQHILNEREYTEMRKYYLPFKWYSGRAIGRYGLHLLCFSPIALSGMSSDYWEITYLIKTASGLLFGLTELLLLPFLLNFFKLDFDGDFLRTPKGQEVKKTKMSDATSA